MSTISCYSTTYKTSISETKHLVMLSFTIFTLIHKYTQELGPQNPARTYCCCWDNVRSIQWISGVEYKKLGCVYTIHTHWIRDNANLISIWATGHTNLHTMREGEEREREKEGEKKEEGREGGRERRRKRGIEGGRERGKEKGRGQKLWSKQWRNRKQQKN